MLRRVLPTELANERYWLAIDSQLIVLYILSIGMETVSLRWLDVSGHREYEKDLPLSQLHEWCDQGRLFHWLPEIALRDLSDSQQLCSSCQGLRWQLNSSNYYQPCLD